MAKLEIAKDYYRQIYQTDISAIDGEKRNPEWARTLLWSYAQNMATKAKKTSIYADVKATQNVTDDTGLEADAVYQMEDGRYALIEIKVGVNKIPEAEKSLLRFRDVIRRHNEEALKNPKHPKAIYREPSALIVICVTAPVGYTTDNGVKIVPVGCLKD